MGEIIQNLSDKSRTGRKLPYLSPLTETHICIVERLLEISDKNKGNAGEAGSDPGNSGGDAKPYNPWDDTDIEGDTIWKHNRVNPWTNWDD